MSDEKKNNSRSIVLKLQFSLIFSFSLCLQLLGSSIRDDCLYSTSTQKQSFDSVTVSQCQSTKMTIDYDLNNQYGDHNKVVILPKQNLLNTGSKMCRYQKQRQMNDPIYGSDGSAKNDKSHEIRISINCANRIKPKSESKLIRFFQNITRWRLHSRHIGYYSPRTNHSIDTINVRLNPVVVVTNNDAHQISERNLVRYDNGNGSSSCNNNNNKHFHDNDDGVGSGNGNGNDDDSISNSSLRDDNEMAIKDELSAYMEELRLREIR